MSIFEKISNFKASFYPKFEKNKKIFYIWTSLFLLVFIGFSVMSFYENKAFPKPLEYLYMAEGEVISSAHSSKRKSDGALTLRLDNGDLQYFNIHERDKEIYKSLLGKRAKIYSSQATLLRKQNVEQIENIDGEILKKIIILL